MSSKYVYLFFIGAVLSAFLSINVQAEYMPPVYDSDLIERDLIVVARIDRASLSQSDSHSNASLIIEEVIKGETQIKYMPIRINMLVVVGGFYNSSGRMINLRVGKNKDYPKDKIEAVRDMDRNFIDLSKNAIWFLARSMNGFFVSRVEHIQENKLIKYYKVLLTDDWHSGVVKFLESDDKDLRFHAVKYLEEKHQAEDAPVLAGLVDDSDRRVRWAAAYAAAQAGDITSVTLFRKMLEHDDEVVRATAAMFLCRFRDRESVENIRKSLHGNRKNLKENMAYQISRMESRLAVPLLIDLLNETEIHVLDSLYELTGIQFPPDYEKAAAVWKKYEKIDEEILLRKTLETDIKNLTHSDNNIRWRATKRLGKITNRHIDGKTVSKYSSEFAARGVAQQLWKDWMCYNLSKSRLEWIYDGFNSSGIDLPRPMNKDGIDTLIEVIRFYKDMGKGKEHDGKKWILKNGHQAGYHIYNANLLLEKFTGYCVGLDPYFMDIRTSAIRPKEKVLLARWEKWWRENKDNCTLKEWPEEKKITKEMIRNAPAIPAPD